MARGSAPEVAVDVGAGGRDRRGCGEAAERRFRGMAGTALKRLMAEYKRESGGSRLPALEGPRSPPSAAAPGHAHTGPARRSPRAEGRAAAAAAAAALAVAGAGAGAPRPAAAGQALGSGAGSAGAVTVLRPGPGPRVPGGWRVCPARS